VKASNVNSSLPSNENRLLTSQLTILNPQTGSASSSIIEPKDATRRSRRGLASLLGLALRKAQREGVIPDYPDTLAVVIHFSRADLTHLRDWKDICRRMDAVRGTFPTATKPFHLNVPTRRAESRSDQGDGHAALAPGRMRSRSASERRLVPGFSANGLFEGSDGLFKENPISLLNTHHRHVIAALWARRVWHLLANGFGIQGASPRSPRRVRMICDLMTRSGQSVDEYFGYEESIGSASLWRA
jgi:hypothetical protein